MYHSADSTLLRLACIHTCMHAAGRQTALMLNPTCLLPDQDAAGNPHYAIPPLDSDKNWKWRKLAFMAGVNSRPSAQKYIDVLSGSFDAELAALGADGANFSLWDTINR